MTNSTIMPSRYEQMFHNSLCAPILLKFFNLKNQTGRKYATIINNSDDKMICFFRLFMTYQRF